MISISKEYLDQLNNSLFFNVVPCVTNIKSFICPNKRTQIISIVKLLKHLKL